MSDRRLLFVVLLAGCGDGTPPLDALGLRDALTADPEVIASLPASARRSLAERLEAARAGEPNSEELAVTVEAGAGATASRVDRARQEHGRDAVMVASYEPAARTLFVHPVPDSVGERNEGEPIALAGSSSLESAALDGKAGAIVNALVAASGAKHVERVTGWPVGAVAIGETVYVNGAWLTALAPAESTDGGIAPIAMSAAPRKIAAQRTSSMSVPIVAPQQSDSDGQPAHADPILPSDNPPSSSSIPTGPQQNKNNGNSCDSSSAIDACGSGADLCGSCDASDCDSADFSDCGDGLGDCGGGGDCSIAARQLGHLNGKTGAKMMLLLAPLVFLLRRRRGDR
jgi:hypothetical protein